MILTKARMTFAIQASPVQSASAAPASLPSASLLTPSQMLRLAWRGHTYRLRDAAPDRMSAADWPGQNSSPEAETGRQNATASSRQTTLSAAMAPAATHFRLPCSLPPPHPHSGSARVCPAERVSSSYGNAARPTTRTRLTSSGGGCGLGRSFPLAAVFPRSQSRSAAAGPGGVAGSVSLGAQDGPRAGGGSLGSHPVPTELHDARHSIPVPGYCTVPLYRVWAELAVGTGSAGLGERPFEARRTE